MIQEVGERKKKSIILSEKLLGNCGGDRLGQNV
jgi:hypothetical protein